jgi:hypothetical protein
MCRYVQQGIPASIFRMAVKGEGVMGVIDQVKFSF